MTPTLNISSTRKRMQCALRKEKNYGNFNIIIAVFAISKSSFDSKVDNYPIDRVDTSKMVSDRLFITYPISRCNEI